MAVVTTNTFLNFGTFGTRQGIAPSTAQVNGIVTNGGLAFPFIADKTITATSVSSMLSSIGTTFSLALTVGIQTDSGGGIPSGTFLTNGSVTIPANTFTTAMQFTANSGTTTITTSIDHYLTVGNVIWFVNTTGGVSTSTNYYVKSVPTSTTLTISVDQTLATTFTFSANVTLGANTFARQSGWVDIPLAGASLTQGTPYWVVWQFSGTGSGTLNFFTAYAGGGSTTQNVIYGLGYATRVGAAFSKATTTRGVPVMYSDGTSYYGTPDKQGGIVRTATVNNNDRLGFRFTVPSTHPDILIDRITIGITPSAQNTGVNWKCQIFTDVASPVLIADLSSIDGNNVAGVSSTTNSTVFQASVSQWLTAGSSYILMFGFDITPTSAPTMSYWQNGLTISRNALIGPYVGDFIYNFQGLGTWFTSNPAEFFPWSITASALRYDNSSGGGGGGFANASSGFAGIGGN